MAELAAPRSVNGSARNGGPVKANGNSASTPNSTSNETAASNEYNINGDNGPVRPFYSSSNGLTYSSASSKLRSRSPAPDASSMATTTNIATTSTTPSLVLPSTTSSASLSPSSPTSTDTTAHGKLDGLTPVRTSATYPSPQPSRSSSPQPSRSPSPQPSRSPSRSPSPMLSQYQTPTLQSDGLRRRKLDPLVPISYSTSTYNSYEPFSTPTGAATTKKPLYEHTSSGGFPRISRPVEVMHTSYDCVVIGSGYGGAVAASRMSRGNKSVCLLERGRERWPGEFPKNIVEAAKLLHVSGLRESFTGLGSGKIYNDGGDPTELYHLVLGEGQNVFVGNGLGGTSLLNANVFLPADHPTLRLEHWPREIRENPECLDKYYQRAESVLEPKPYPEDYPTLPKLKLLEKQAEALGYSDRFRRVKQTTRFEDGPNSTGVQMHASTLSGQDSTGLNDGSKSSTLVNYLSDAWNWGAEMFCQTEVRYIEKHPEGKGYLIYFAWHGSHRGAFKEEIHEDYMWVHARECVFLGAGALGTTEILLRSKAMGLDIGGEIGTQMSGNGDILSFGYDTSEHVNAVGRVIPDPSRPVGPTICGIIDCRNETDPRDGFVIEEGAVPAALAPFMEVIIGISEDRHTISNFSYTQRLRKFRDGFASLILGPSYLNGSLEKTQVYLVMSHDSNQAVLKLVRDKPVLSFSGVGHQHRVKELHEVLRKATEAVNGTYVDSPFYASFGEQQITVHPIGGAVMSRDGTGSNGVTNQFGQVFTGLGREVHKGLVCVDASVIPTALGANPFATITALAERSVEHVAEQFGVKIDYDTKNGPLDLFGVPQHSRPESECRKKIQNMILKKRANDCQGFSFSEVMSGFIHIGSGIKDYELAYISAKGRCEAARFFLNVRSWDIDDMISSSTHPAMLTGSFACGLRGSPFMINHGNFSLLTNDKRTSDTKNLVYDFIMTSTYGDKVHFHGYKIVNTSVALNPMAYWKATTTLYVTLADPHDQTIVFGRGIMHIKPKDFLPELISMAPTGSSVLSRVAATSKFIKYFIKQSAGLFFSPLTWQQYPSPTYHGFTTEVRPDRQVNVTASDGVLSVVKMWSPKGTRPLSQKKAPAILMIAGAAVDDQIFALPTIDTNAVAYFRQHGYRIYTVTHRIGKSPSNESNCPTTFDARLDIAAAVKYVSREQGSEKFYIIAHCMGSVALAMGLLEGSIPTSHIKGITASQTFMNPKWSPLNMLKTKSPVTLDGLYRRLAGTWYPIGSHRNDFYVQQAINQLLRLYPVGGRNELCRSVACHRCSFVFGRCWNHENLNSETHDQIDRFFSGVNMNFLRHAMNFGRIACATGPEPLNVKLTTPENLERLRGIPIFLFSGADNAVLDPVSTELTYTSLQGYFHTDALYDRQVIPNYGHLDCWMGKNAAHDVFPIIRKHVDNVMLGFSDL